MNPVMKQKRRIEEAAYLNPTMSLKLADKWFNP